MALWWLSYRQGETTAGVTIIEASSISHARMLVAIEGLDTGLDFADGLLLHCQLAAMISLNEVGRLLSPQEATRIVEFFEAATDLAELPRLLGVKV
jgi:hypothetical protein